MDYRIGVGLGGGFSFNPLDQGQDTDKQDGSYIGAYCSASASIAGSTISTGATAGYTSNSNYFLTNQTGVSTTNTGFGLKIGASIGVGGGFF